MRRHETKIYNKVDYMHKKISRQVLNEYKIVLLPKVNSKNMIEGDLSPGVKRMINMGSQCKFHDYISYQGKERVIKVDERFTTKRCANCHSITDIGKSRIYECSGCDYVSGRDVNSAVNILIKNLDKLYLSKGDTPSACQFPAKELSFSKSKIC